MEKTRNLEQSSLGKRLGKAARTTALYALVSLAGATAGAKAGAEIGDNVAYEHAFKTEFNYKDKLLDETGPSAEWNKQTNSYTRVAAFNHYLNEENKQLESSLAGIAIGGIAGACTAGFGLRKFRNNYFKREAK